MGSKAPLCPANAPLVAALSRRARTQFSQQHMARTLTRAAGSICKYPLPVTSAEQAIQLEHIGPTVADLIGEILGELAVAAAAAPPPPATAAGGGANAGGSSSLGPADHGGSGGAPAPAAKRQRKGAGQRRVLADAFARDSTTPDCEALAQLAAASQCDEAYIRRFFADLRRKLSAASSAGPTAGGAAAAAAVTIDTSGDQTASPAAAAAAAPVANAGGGRAYYPKERTGNWAVMIALAENVRLYIKMMIPPLTMMILPSKMMISPLQMMILPSKMMILPLENEDCL